MSERMTWDEYGLSLAHAASLRVACNRRQVGAVIMDLSHRVVSMGYNGTPAGMVNCSDGGCPRGQLSYDECPAFGSYSNCTGGHAEDNAIEYADVDLTGFTIYITCAPCDDCRLLIHNAGIKRAVWPEGEYSE